MSVTPMAMAWAADLLGRAAVPVGELPSASIPAGYREVRAGDERVFWPPADPSLPVVGLSPAPVGDPTGTAGTILAALLPEWRSANAWQPTSSGRTLSGWRFDTSRGDFGRPGPDGSTYVAALLMVLACSGQERLLWALGSPARAILDGEPLLRVLHALPVADGTPSEAELILGTWRLTTGYGVSQYTFRADGSFERGMSATTTFGITEHTTSTAKPGRYEVTAGILELTSGDGGDSFRARVFDELGYGAETPLRQLGLLPVEPGPEVDYALVV